MILGYLILAVAVGLLSFLFTLLSGFSIWFAFGVYTAVSTIILIALLLTAILIGNQSPDQERATLPRKLWTGRRTVNFGKRSVDHA